MITALTVWENRISPVFDSSQTLLVAQIKNKKIVSRHLEPFNPSLPSHLADRLDAIGVEIFICGAISQLPADIIEAMGIKLIPFITGNTDEVLENLIKDQPIIPGFLMPGCRSRNHKNYYYGRPQSRRNPKKGVNHMPRGDGTGPKGKGAGKGQGRCKSGQFSKGSKVKPRPSKRQGQGAGSRQVRKKAAARKVDS
jgi:predicted Fe-Mo cluster-binding NifX family protein